jgi:uncharacterized flavoprotein (TIGR03862 family)
MSIVGLTVAVVGAGPAGLIAAQTLADAGLRVVVIERGRMPGRKLLLAGRGGLNLTHAEPHQVLVSRYGDAAETMRSWLDGFTSGDLRAWADALGAQTFVGTSRRVFPRALKATGLLRAWLARLAADGVHFRLQTEWTGQDGTRPILRDAGGVATLEAAATVLALGGASWPRLGADGTWVPVLERHGVAVTPLRAANVGVEVAWSPGFAGRFQGMPLKNLAAACGDRVVRGEALVTRHGLEGGVVYALGPAIRAALDASGSARLHLDLRADLPETELEARLARRRRGDSTSRHLERRGGLAPVARALLREAAPVLPDDPGALARLIKAAPLTVRGLRPIAEAISTAGGIALDGLDERLMLRRLPGVFACGEMLDWDAPTGGYLLQACLATGVAAARGVIAWLGDEALRSPG